MLVFLISFSGLIAGERNRTGFVSGEAIVKLSAESEIDNLVQEVNLQHPTWSLKFRKTILESERVYLLAFDHRQISHAGFLSALGGITGVEQIQNNHYLEERLTPNDGDFPFQWQYVNSGQSGGTPNADLDADLAWELSIGSQTIFGEDIVMCVIDDGILSTHPDLINNLWVNENEIPNNGIDDDANGYIDDYRGWNTDDENDDIDGVLPDHGTAVCGIVGAEGNNGQGVCGVSWNNKLMVVVGGGVESQALAAYNYPLKMRQMYRESDGEKGAFVVVTNASWGVTGADPADSPLWCEMYDLLGAEGIINVAATTNSNTNVDVQGDMPTACASDHLISVTNLNDTDEKVQAAGYGVESIDLGAYGEDVYTTNISGGYGSFGGTSAAAPHVAGAIGLLYACDCPGFLQLAKSDPEAASLLAREAIMNGTTANESLANNTVSGGRLNLNGSLLWLLENCPTACTAPPFVEVEQQDTNRLQFSWTNVDANEIAAYEIHFMGNVEGEEIDSIYTLSPTVSFWEISGLNTCEEYLFEIRSECDDTFTDWSNALNVFTDGCCVPPENLVATQEGELSYLLTWDAVTAAELYEITIIVDNGSVLTFESMDNSLAILLDQICSEISIQIQSNCDLSDPNEFSLITVETDCASCTAVNYCDQESEDAQFDQIASVQIGEDIHLNESDNTSLFVPYQGFQMVAGSTELMTIVPSILIPNSNEYMRVWIDEDQDGEFSENELLLDSGPQMGSYSSDIMLSDDAEEGFTRMRVALQYNLAPEICVNPDFGQVIDYCLEILANPSSEIVSLAKTDLKVFPNPAKDFINFESTDNIRSINFYDVNGSLMIQEYPASREFQFSVNTLPDGMYFAEIQLEDSSKKFISFLKTQ